MAHFDVQKQISLTTITLEVPGGDFLFLILFHRLSKTPLWIPLLYPFSRAPVTPHHKLGLKRQAS